jgi:hypothetical protein
VRSGDGSVTITFTPSVIVTPSQTSPGATVAISGASCGTFLGPVSTSTVGTVGTVTGSVAFPTPLAFGPIVAATDGTWSTSIVVPAGTPAGTYPVNATCSVLGVDSVSAQATTDFPYDPGSITITIPIVAKFAG